MSNEELKQNNYLSHPHRGGIEYQIGIRIQNIQEFDAFKIDPAALVQCGIIEANNWLGTDGATK